MVAVVLGGGIGAEARHLLNSQVASPPLPGVTSVSAQPIPTSTGGEVAPPIVLPTRVLLQVPFTTRHHPALNQGQVLLLAGQEAAA